MTGKVRQRSDLDQIKIFKISTICVFFQNKTNFIIVVVLFVVVLVGAGFIDSAVVVT